MTIRDALETVDTSKTALENLLCCHELKHEELEPRTLEAIRLADEAYEMLSKFIEETPRDVLEDVEIDRILHAAKLIIAPSMEMMSLYAE